MGVKVKNMKVKIGCCGFPRNMSLYFKNFKVVEVQKTFYKPPRIETLENWRERAGRDSEFTIKAFQAITHPPTSPTWRKAGLKVEPGKRDKYGFLKPTEENFKAWEETVKAAEALKAKIVVVQTPSSFTLNKENIERLYEFFKTVDRRGLIVVWEPRGSWLEDPETTSKIMEDLELIHGVDILRYKPLSRTHIVYCRLHGLGGREVNYKYKYTSDDLLKLRVELENLSNNCELAYVMFNNVYMWNDALEFKKMCSLSKVLECM